MDGAPDEERPLCVAVSNTLISAVTILGGGLGLIAYSVGIQTTRVVLIIQAPVATGLCRALPEAHEMTVVRTLHSEIVNFILYNL